MEEIIACNSGDVKQKGSKWAPFKKEGNRHERPPNET